MKDVRRRRFLGGIVAGIVGLFVPKVKAQAAPETKSRDGWTEIVVSIDGNICLYVNGSLVMPTCVYSRALSAAEVQSHYQNPYQFFGDNPKVKDTVSRFGPALSAGPVNDYVEVHRGPMYIENGFSVSTWVKLSDLE